jgi:hypothetical protein
VFKNITRALLGSTIVVALALGVAGLPQHQELPKARTHQTALPEVQEPVIDWSKFTGASCLVTKDNFGFRTCPRGTSTGYWDVAFIGDSHMRQYFAVLDYLALKYKWRVTFISKSACPVGNHAILPDHISASCRDWNARLENYLNNRKAFDFVINSNSAFVSHGSPRVGEAYRSTVLSEVKRGASWFVISDNPKPRLDFIDCLSQFGAANVQHCSLPYSRSMKPIDIMPIAIQGIPNTYSIDLRTKFCPHNICPPLINGRIVYRDKSHISALFARTLVGYIDAAIPAKFKGLPDNLVLRLMRPGQTIAN